MRIVLIRHGMTEGNYKKRYIGATDEPLGDTKSLDLDYPECEMIIVSPMRRCIETAEHIYPLRDIKIFAELRECDFGDFENKSYEDLKENKDYIKWIGSGGTLPFPNGESHDDFKRRCVEGFYSSLSAGCESAAFVIHGGSIMAIMQHIFGGGFYDYQIRNGGMFCFEYDEKARRAENGFVRREQR